MKHFQDFKMSPIPRIRIGGISGQLEMLFTISRERAGLLFPKVETNESKNSSCMFEVQSNKDYSMSMNYCIT